MLLQPGHNYAIKTSLPRAPYYTINGIFSVFLSFYSFFRGCSERRGRCQLECKSLKGWMKISKIYSITFSQTLQTQSLVPVSQGY